MQAKRVDGLSTQYPRSTALSETTDLDSHTLISMEQIPGSLALSFPSFGLTFSLVFQQTALLADPQRQNKPIGEMPPRKSPRLILCIHRSSIIRILKAVPAATTGRPPKKCSHQAAFRLLEELHAEIITIQKANSARRKELRARTALLRKGKHACHRLQALHSAEEIMFRAWKEEVLHEVQDLREKDRKLAKHLYDLKDLYDNVDEDDARMHPNRPPRPCTCTMFPCIHSLNIL